MPEPLYTKWLHEKCEAIVKSRTRKLTSGQKLLIEHFKWRIETLFQDDPQNSEEYKQILKTYGLNPSEFCKS